MTLARKLRLEALFLDGLAIATISWIVFGALPLLAILIVALVTGDYTPEGVALTHHFPLYLLPWWAMYPQTVLLLVLAGGSIPLPLRQPGAGTRFTLLVTQVFTLATGLFVTGVTLTSDPGLWALVIVVVIQAGLLGLTALRTVLGWLRLVPRSWREYIADDGTVIAPRDITQIAPRRPWGGRVRARGGGRP